MAISARTCNCWNNEHCKCLTKNVVNKITIHGRSDEKFHIGGGGKDFIIISCVWTTKNTKDATKLSTIGDERN